jgi:DNA primase
VAGRIPQSFIDDLVSRADIVEVIDSHVPLKKAGREHKACCPFHDEKTPSFTVSSEKQFYHCFGCGAHGTVLGFLMNYRHLEFVEAVEALAQRLGLDVPHEDDEGRPATAPTAPLYELLARASSYYQRQLREHPERARAVEYLKSRGLSGEIAAEFKLGYAPPGWDNLTRALGPGEAERNQLVRAGLSVERSERAYDRFRDRVMFPILDRRGRTIGFGGRVLGDDTPKYLNSPEGAIFHKGRELYGAYQAISSSKTLQRVIVVEGYMDVVALAQHGVANAVATLGTSATSDHVEQLFRMVPDVVFCFDGDEAGRRAAWRALETALPRMRDGRQAFFMFLPEGEDPDSLVRSRGGEAFEKLAADAPSLGTFLFDRLVDQVDLGTIDGRSRMVELARPLLVKIAGSQGTATVRGHRARGSQFADARSQGDKNADPTSPAGIGVVRYRCTRGIGGTRRAVATGAYRVAPPQPGVRYRDDPGALSRRGGRPAPGKARHRGAGGAGRRHS